MVNPRVPTYRLNLQVDPNMNTVTELKYPKSGRPFPGTMLGLLAAVILIATACQTAAPTADRGPRPADIGAIGTIDLVQKLEAEIKLRSKILSPQLPCSSDTLLSTEGLHRLNSERLKDRRKRSSRVRKFDMIAKSVSDFSTVLDWSPEHKVWGVGSDGSLGATHSHLLDMVRGKALSLRYYPSQTRWRGINRGQDHRDDTYIDLRCGPNEFKLLLRVRN